MTGCATRAPGPGPAPASNERDGPLPNPPADLARVPDAVPRLEPIRIGGRLSPAMPVVEGALASA